ncbi:MAG: L-histidine N(alpha)-methyltransferase, partial [bacterium]|nr:L-histidine N(alpha)-methyltransferase [bacterium]
MRDRIQIRRFTCAEGQSTFADDVRRGLSSQPKYLLPKYFYDALGSHLFEAICHLPEYYPTRTELGILTDEGDAIVEALAGRHRLIELGSGSSAKTRLLIEA